MKKRTESIIEKIHKKLSHKNKRVLEDCVNSGKHGAGDRGNLSFVLGTIHADVPVQCCRVGIRVYGTCPNCKIPYEREPTNEEKQTQKYKEMSQQLQTYRILFRKCSAPF